ncbi:retinoblastoma-like protein 2 [Patella vulgata]|uniref:retinoblastoma-like protein 2 n=1 Tax=Patella vulgata TaxID=6465 RepID=UPI0024A983C0|nr:retinoblastoma-like protein 2 [Patella vulgata]
MFDLSPYHFYKVIEIIIRAEEGLSRDVVKHLNHIEETILESLAWRSESPLWDAIREQESGVPTCEEVTPANHVDLGNSSNNSPLLHPRIKTLTVEAGKQTLSPVRVIKTSDPLLSPTGPTISDRFSSPQPGTARRQLFTAKSESTTQTPTQTILQKQLAAGASETVVIPQQGESMIAVIVDGRQVLIPLQSIIQARVMSTPEKSPAKHFKPKKTGSLALFFRKVTGKPVTFQNIMKCYRYQPQSHSHIYRSVLLSGRRRHTSGSSEGSKSAASGTSSPVNTEKEDKKRDVGNIRSSSTLPIPQPNSQPPTPTKLIGAAATFDFGEERGDLIQFYNMVFVDKLREFALQFSQTQSNKQPCLSPLPSVRSHIVSPRRVTTSCPVYISPHKAQNRVDSPKGMSFCINKSPANDLRAINNMIKMGEKKITGKRLLEVDRDDDSLDSPSKRICQGNFLRRLQNVNMDRKEANGLTS